jgi:glutamine amidotransferase
VNKKKKIVIIDYGCGNILSIKKAVENFKKNILVTNKYEEIMNSSHIILPGVGAFNIAMKNLKKLKIIKIIQYCAKKNKPILGICLGMQLLLTKSEENKKTNGLNLIEGSVEKIKRNKKIKIPHVGWNKIILTNKNNFLKKITQNSSMYFVHSYYAKMKNKNDILSLCQYGKSKIPAIIGNNNIYGTQFHPEKSGKNGLKLIHNFLSLKQ